MHKPPLRQAKTIDNVFNSAFWHLSQQDFTVNEIRQKLERKTENQQWIDTVIKKLIDDGFLKSDLQFAIRFSESCFFNEMGAAAIKQKLKKRGLKEADIQQAIEQVAHEQNIDEDRLAVSRLNNSFQTFANTTKEKLYQQMTNKGFSRAQVDKALAQHPAKASLKTKLEVKAEKADLTKEIIKLYKKGKGKSVILQELKQRLIDVSEFNDKLYQLEANGEVDFFESCKQQLSKKKYDMNCHKGRAKAYAYLYRKGFSSDEINEAFNAA
ncbi:RecX family transcriptional regulator [Paraferrimonas sp. SM1919]|uniref:RecX family transcriptional regulator n=1 Tax=Paraferrimonas sp. SM1919 TaxID=2662263 RepID=UPI0013D7EE3E|nr:RecX family transcriptional regulator [Paraferrimonas sp. SM1919]